MHQQLKILATKMTSVGMFITFEGGEGTGKTTQISCLAKTLITLLTANKVLVTREPGGVASAEKIRDLLVNGDAEKWKPATEALLISAARHEHVERIIRPALNQNKVVISDRFIDSTIIYQGIVGGVESRHIDFMNKIACDEVFPDLTIILDMDSKIGLKRAQMRGKGEDRFEAKGPAFHEKIRAGFIDLAARHSQRCVLLDANRSVEAIADEISGLVMARLSTMGNILGDRKSVD